MIGAADDVRDPEVEVVDDGRELVGRRPVAAQQRRRPGEPHGAVGVPDRRRPPAPAPRPPRTAHPARSAARGPPRTPSAEPRRDRRGSPPPPRDGPGRVGVVDAQDEHRRRARRRSAGWRPRSARSRGGASPSGSARSGRGRSRQASIVTWPGCEATRSSQPGSPGTGRDRSRPRARRACTRRARCPRSCNARRRGTPAPRDAAPSRRAPRSRPSSSPGAGRRIARAFPSTRARSARRRCTARGCTARRTSTGAPARARIRRPGRTCVPSPKYQRIAFDSASGRPSSSTSVGTRSAGIQVSEQLRPARAVDDVYVDSLVREPEEREQEPDLVAVARDRRVVEQHIRNASRPDVVRFTRWTRRCSRSSPSATRSRTHSQHGWPATHGRSTAGPAGRPRQRSSRSVPVTSRGRTRPTGSSSTVREEWESSITATSRT